MKHLISFVCAALILSVFPLQAEKVDADKAERLAQRFVQSKRRVPAEDLVRLNFTATQKHRTSRAASGMDAVQDTVFYYVFNISESAGGGFVIVSGDDAVTPVLGYSDNGNYDENNLPPNFAYWMNCLQDEIRRAIAQKLPQSETVRQKWEDYLNGNVSVTAVASLISTAWAQGAPYSDLCPLYNGRRCVTGCVATAMAQIMNYHRHPTRGRGQSTAYITYPLKINMPSVSFEVNYDWENMLNSYRGSPTSQQQTAVATLMYHCGLSVKMNYTPDGSGALTSYVPAALINYFGYDNSCSEVKKSNYTTAAWENLIKGQLDAGMPVLYSGEGEEGRHAFICDGYRDDGTFHFNWGWGGNADGWFVTTALNTNQGTFNIIQEMVINIKPAVNVPVTGVSLNITTATVPVGATEELTVTIEPAGATNKNVTWSSSNTNVATVNNIGIVTGVSEGAATITVTTQDGNRKATCSVTVVPAFTLSADQFEPNNTLSQASMLAASFTNDMATVKTTGSNFHNDTDIDYYKIELPSGYSYAITARIHDMYSSEDGNTYTVDAKFSYLTDGADWSEKYDNVMYNDNILLNDGGTVYFLAEPYFANFNRTGTYLLEISVERELIFYPDPYEPNNVPEQAYLLPVAFTDDMAAVTTNGSNFHNDTDIDYYKIELPSGYSYTITARLHDSYNSDDGNTYTVDARFTFSTDPGTWSEFYDDFMPEDILLNDGGTVHFFVEPFFEGDTGDYLLDISIVRASKNADLVSLDVNPGTLSTPFNAKTITYTVNVAFDVTTVTVSATAVDENATVEGTGSYELYTGSNTITVTVTAQDGVTVNTYTITVIRAAPPSNNANLGSLTVNTGTLTPSFSPNITNYSVIVASGVKDITITGKPEDDDAVVSGNGNHPLNVGNNSLVIEVTAADKKTVKKYTVSVFREKPNSVNDNQGEPLKAYPNPAQDKITISGLQGNGILTVFDETGRQLIIQSIASPQETVSVSKLPQGIYFVVVVEGKNMRTIKIIVE